MEPEGMPMCVRVIEAAVFCARAAPRAAPPRSRGGQAQQLPPPHDDEIEAELNTMLGAPAAAAALADVKQEA